MKSKGPGKVLCTTPSCTSLASEALLLNETYWSRAKGSDFNASLFVRMILFSVSNGFDKPWSHIINVTTRSYFRSVSNKPTQTRTLLAIFLGCSYFIASVYFRLLQHNIENRTPSSSDQHLSLFQCLPLEVSPSVSSFHFHSIVFPLLACSPYHPWNLLVTTFLWKCTGLWGKQNDISKLRYNTTIMR